MNKTNQRAAEGKAWAALLVKWYEENARPLPWREDHDPYHVWISEIMLQQTRIEAVMGYYQRFMETLPSVEALANAEEDTVLKLWEGLGYYSRARNLHKAAREILLRKDGAFPSSFEEILSLPGIGEYTAGAISAISFGLPETAVDGNVMRVVSRLEELEGNVLEESSRKIVRTLLKEIYPFETDEEGEIHYQSSSFVQGLMELGETVCLPSQPRCEACPLKELCLAHKSGREEELPLRIKKQKRTIEERMVVLIKKEDGEMLFFKRPENTVLGGLWEMPNVLCEARGSEKPAEKAAELTTEINAIVAAYGLEFSDDAELKKVGKYKHVFSHITWNLHLYEMNVKNVRINTERQFVWSDPYAIMLPTAFKKLLS